MNHGAIEPNTVLIVDDTPEVLDVLITLMEQVGFKPLVAQSGEEALERIEHVQPDLILLDVLMPDMDGFEVCRRLKGNEETKDIPVIFMTALSDAIDKVKGFELGAVDYITKPFQHEEVLARIKAHLTIRHLQQQLEEANRTLEQRVLEQTADLRRANEALQEEITERKWAEEALQEWASFVCLNPSPVLRFDPKGQIILANPAAHTIFGSDALEGRLLNEIFPSVPTEHFVQTILNDSISTYESQIGEQDYHFVVRGVRELEIGHIYGSNITERKWAEEALKASYEQLRNLPAHLQAVREEERTTIAREIHDELGQALIALKMDLSWLKRRFTNDQAELLEKAHAMEELIDSIIQVVKKIVTALRPGLLDDLGLSAAIEWQAEEFQQRTGIQCNVIIDPEDIILKDDLSTAVFRIFQETLTNVARHARATEVHVLLRETEESLLLEVRDNGQGITPTQISDPTSFGLIGIRERAQFLGGQVTFQGVPRTGTTVTVSIPL